MIREYELKDEVAVRDLGKYLDGSFEFSKIGENERIYVFEKDSKVLGFIVFSKNFEVADLTYIVVHPDYRRLGIAGELLKCILKNGEIERIMLEVRESNKSAIEFYKKNEFKILRVIPNYYGTESALAMERRIR